MDGANAPLEGRSVRLRPLAEADLPVVHAWYEDPELSAPFDRYATEGFESFRSSVAAAPNDPTSLAPRFLIERRRDSARVGCVGHYRSHPVLTILEVWYLIGEPSARGAGLGSEAVGLLVDHLFATTAVERVAATSDVENLASQRLAEKIGLRREGTLRRVLFHHGRWHDVAVFGVTRSERPGTPPAPPA